MNRNIFTPKRVAIGSFLVFVAARLLAAMSLLGIYDATSTECLENSTGLKCNPDIQTSGLVSRVFAYISIVAFLVCITAVIKLLVNRSKK